MLSTEAIEQILGIQKGTIIDPVKMASSLRLTIFPFQEEDQSENVLNFLEILKRELVELGVTILPYQESLKHIPLHRALMRCFQILFRNISAFFRNILRHEKTTYIHLGVLKNILLNRDRIRPGISVLAVGEHPTGALPMDRTISFTDTSVITILDMPDGIDENTVFSEHFDISMSLFAKHMTNIVIGVNEKEWILYNFNASHPVYPLIGDGLRKGIIFGLIPKIVAPIRPNKLSEFSIQKKHFSLNEGIYPKVVDEFINAGKLFESTNLYPKGKKLDELPFRSDFYKWIGKIHLDQRNGMSFGFLAWQMPTKLSKIYDYNEEKNQFGEALNEEKDWFHFENKLHVVLEHDKRKIILEVPTVNVMTQRSGSDKTKIIPAKDLLEMSISSGEMSIQTPDQLVITEDYRPSFDTRVILAHATGNAIIASILRHFDENNEFAHRIETEGCALAHWHGYVNKQLVPQGWHVHGFDKPNVACSSPQSAIYAIDGKLRSFSLSTTNQMVYNGDIHIEPHHGTNITYPSLVDLAKYFIDNPNTSELGNKHLSSYT